MIRLQLMKIQRLATKLECFVNMRPTPIRIRYTSSDSPAELAVLIVRAIAAAAASAESFGSGATIARLHELKAHAQRVIT